MNNQQVTDSVEQLMTSLLRLRRTAQTLADETLAVETALRRVVVEITGRLSHLGATIEGLEAVVAENSGAPAASSCRDLPSFPGKPGRRLRGRRGKGELITP